MRLRPLLPALLLLVLPFFAACDAGHDDRIVEGVDLDALFAPPMPDERESVLDQWRARDVSAQQVSAEATSTVVSAGRIFDVTVVSHAVAGARHYGAILVPQGASGRLPVLIYAHGGDQGASVEEAALVATLVAPPGRDFVWIVPSFRAETLRFGSATYRSEGPASPWDYDVDDALALLEVALSGSYHADPARVGAVGISRGGGVALLMAIRDARVRRVLDLFGPTDFFGPYVQDIVEDALRGRLRDLPGFDVLNARFLQPLKSGGVTTEAMRLELLRRSPVYFADRLPAVQVHHGTADDVVNVSQSRRLAAAMRGRADFAYFEWPGAAHNPLSFPINWLTDAQTFLGGL